MTSSWLIGIIAFLAAVLINKSIMTSALRKLDDETKLKFIDVLTKGGSTFSIGLFAVVFLFTGGLRYFPEHQWIIIAGYMAVLVLFMVVRFVINYKKLKEINAPPEYFRSFFTGYGIFVLGIIALLICGSWASFSG